MPDANLIPFVDLAPLHRLISDDLRARWDDIVADSAFIGGAMVERFEQRWAEYCGAAHAVGVANGTEAIELVLLGLGIGAGDEVILPSATFVATAEAVHAVGATPVFADSLDHSVLIDPAHVEALVGPRTAAVIIVHLYGLPVDPGPFVRLCARHGLALIEDAAQGHGARWGDQRIGSLGTAASFSFYPTKNLGAMGDAGAVVTDDPALAAAVTEYSRHGRSATRADHTVVGRNSRMDGLQAAALDLKLDHLDGGNERRRGVATRYRSGLEGRIRFERAAAPGAEAVWHLFPIYVDDRDGLGARLREVGVGTGVHYAEPCHAWPCFREAPHEALPNSERWFGSELSLPMHSSMTDEAADEVVDRLLAALDSGAGRSD